MCYLFAHFSSVLFCIFACSKSRKYLAKPPARLSNETWDAHQMQGREGDAARGRGVVQDISSRFPLAVRAPTHASAPTKLGGRVWWPTEASAIVHTHGEPSQVWTNPSTLATHTQMEVSGTGASRGADTAHGIVYTASLGLMHHQT